MQLAADSIFSMLCRNLCLSEQPDSYQILLLRLLIGVCLTLGSRVFVRHFITLRLSLRNDGLLYFTFTFTFVPRTNVPLFQ